MKARPHRSICQGQAAVEAMLALVLLGGLMHAVVTIGTVSLRGQQTAQLSRLAAFLHTDKHTFVPTEGDIGNAQVQVLARDWLHVDSRLRRAQATDHSVMRLPFSAAVGIAIPAVHRQMVIAADTGHGVDDAAVSDRIRHSEMGWSETARGSTRTADALRRRMQHVDAPWGREEWSMDWLNAWIDLTPVQASPVRRDDWTEH